MYKTNCPLKAVLHITYLRQSYILVGVADHSPPTRAEVKNTSLRRSVSAVKYTDNFAFTLNTQLK
jgi:hypothetical protein